MGRGRSRGRPRGPEEAAPHSQADLRQARRRARLRRLLLHRAEVRPRAQARPGGGGRRGVPRARVGARHLPGRFRELPRRGRREDPRPQAAGRDASALERPAVRRPHVAEVGVPVRRAARDLPPLGPAPRRRWCSTTPPRRAGWYAARSRNRGCSRSSGPTTASRAGTATPIRETRRAPSRTPWGSSGATSSSPCLRSARSPSSTRSSPRGARGSTRRRAAATAGRTGRPTGRTSPPCAPFPAWSSTR